MWIWFNVTEKSVITQNFITKKKSSTAMCVFVEYISKSLGKGYDWKFGLFTFHFLIVSLRNHTISLPFFLQHQIDCSFSDWKPQSQHNFVRRHIRAVVKNFYFAVKSISLWNARISISEKTAMGIWEKVGIT